MFPPSDDGLDAGGHHRVAGRVLFPGRRTAQALSRDGLAGRHGKARAGGRRAGCRERPLKQRPSAQQRPLLAAHGAHFGCAAAWSRAGRLFSRCRALLFVRSIMYLCLS